MTDSIESIVNQQRSAFLDSRDHEERRRWTRTFNAEIGAKRLETYKPEFLPPEAMLERCIYAESRDEVVILPPKHLDNHGMILSAVIPKHFKQLQMGNLANHPTAVDRNGEPRQVPAADLWLSSPDRRCINTVVYAIGRKRLMTVPNGESAVNLWSPTKRLKSEADISLFHQQVTFLMPNYEDRERFLDWLAHCEQQPQVLPHYGWLMWTEQFGVGRNWLASVLTRVWQGEVAPSLDLVALLSGSFNNALSCKRLAVVDEIHIGSSNSLFAMAARLRQLMTEEIRIINPKYGKLTAEFNTTRWLIFSNHDDALPMPHDDRRFEVVRNPNEVQSEDYYAKLYKALDDTEFISSISYYLATRDISRFNPGARPRMTDAKFHIITQSTPQIERDAQETLKEWKAAGIKVFCASDLIRNVGANSQQQAAFSHVLKRAKVVYLCRSNLGGKKERFFAIDKECYAAIEDKELFQKEKDVITAERRDGGLFYHSDPF